MDGAYSIVDTVVSQSRYPKEYPVPLVTLTVAPVYSKGVSIVARRISSGPSSSSSPTSPTSSLSRPSTMYSIKVSPYYYSDEVPEVVVLVAKLVNDGSNANIYSFL